VVTEESVAHGALDDLDDLLDSSNGSNEEEHEERLRKHLVRVFEKQQQQQKPLFQQTQQQQQQDERPVERKALKRLQALVQQQGEVSWPKKTTGGGEERLELLVVQLNGAVMQRMPPTGEPLFRAFWNAAARPPWPVVPSTSAASQVPLPLGVLAGYVDQYFSVSSFALLCVRPPSRYALLADFQREHFRSHLAVIVEPATAETTTLLKRLFSSTQPPQQGEMMDAAKKDPEEGALLSLIGMKEQEQRALKWRYVGMTLAGLALSHLLLKKNKNNKEKKSSTRKKNKKSH